LGIIRTSKREEIMIVSVSDMDATRKRIEVLVPQELVERMRDETIKNLQRRVKIKGFRPGRVPKEMITFYYRDVIEEEVKRRIMEETLLDALREASLEPLVKPIAEYIEKDGLAGYVLECEVVPLVDVREYKGVEVEVKSPEVKQEEIDRRLEELRNMHAVIREKEGEAVAELGDIAILKYQGFIEGRPVNEAGTDFYPLELGKGIFMPEFENAIVGMKKGEEKEVEILFPEDYPDKGIAGKKVLFKVLLKELKEKVLPELSDEFAKDLSFDSLEALREEVVKSIRKEKEAFMREYVFRTVMDKIGDGIEVPIPSRYLESRVEDVLEDLKERMREDNLVEEERKKLREEVEKRVKEEIREEFILLNIAKKEEIAVSEEEKEEEIKRISENMKRPYVDMKEFFEKNGLMGYIRNRVLLKKARDFLISNAQIKEIT
jgi:trigger factor